MNFEQFIERLLSLSICNSVHEKLSKIQFESQFRAPELDMLNWISLANVLRSLDDEQLGTLLLELSSPFNEGEKSEIKRALTGHRAKIKKMIASTKVSDQDKIIAAQWLASTESAHAKFESLIED
ncbi:hypothetical protein UY456_23030 [Paenibacillus polymyxa]|uniref:hypothetical protein n=1 Tax=Paenibacillus polymyxa TaxID=1406 RepID=UPI002AB5977D|nr:hypothetical protein [Paenibacillus polymyxa]MDY8095845.1 hypothetical protein [Paenibacillus polymyxa]